MIKQLLDAPDNVAAFTANGEVSAGDFETIILPVCRQKAEQYGELNYLLQLQNDTPNFTIGAWFNDMVLGLQNLTKWNRAAIVTDKQFIHDITAVFSKVMPGEFKGYNHDELSNALQWCAGGFAGTQQGSTAQKNETDTKENIYDAEAIKKLKEIAEGARICFFTTNINAELPQSAPMAIQRVCDKGNLWFISSKESTRNHQILANNKVYLHFANTGSSEYIFLLGEATIHDDKATIEENWTPFAKAWFEGKDDPRVSIIKVKPTEAFYWDDKDNRFFSMGKRLSNAFLNTDFDDGGVEGELKVN